MRASTRHGELTVDEIGEMQPGGARIMDELGRRFWALAYAGKSGNWDLARYMEKESERLLQIMGTVRPKYREDLETFTRENLAPLAAAIETRDREAFDTAVRACVQASDTYHGKYRKGFIRFRIPDRPPDWLDLAPR